MSDDVVFRALADPTRRALLDSLRAHDGQSVTSLCDVAPEMTRFGIMKHLKLLAAAELVIARQDGRSTLHFLNPVPIQRIHRRWVAQYLAPFASSLVELEARFDTA
ncbi:MAG: helix-turn-helix transcriptional regulator [Ilumatobacteraceae bacterium]